MPIELEGDLFLKEINGTEEGPSAMLVDPDHPTGIGSRKQLDPAYPLTEITLLTELVPERGRYTEARHGVGLELDPNRVVGGADVETGTAQADTKISITMHGEDDHLVRLRNPDDNSWLGDALVGWDLSQVLDSESEYHALLEVTYDHEASLSRLGEDVIEQKRKEDGKYIDILR